MSPPAWLAAMRLETRPISGTGGYVVIAPERIAALLALAETLAGPLPLLAPRRPHVREEDEDGN
jgi:hypothetical protein